MKKRLLLVSVWVASIGIASGSLDTDKIDQVTGLKGKRGLTRRCSQALAGLKISR